MSATEIITTGNSHTKLEGCVGKEFSAIGDGLQYGSSGGYFAIEYETGNLDNMGNYLQLGGKNTTNDTSKTEYYGSVKIDKTLPTQYKSIKITACTEVANTNATDGLPICKLTFAWVPKTTTISIGQTVSLTTGTQYSFPSGSSTHKVQGDPTVYYGTSFYVSSSGTYTIEQ